MNAHRIAVGERQCWRCCRATISRRNSSSQSHNSTLCAGSCCYIRSSITRAPYTSPDRPPTVPLYSTGLEWKAHSTPTDTALSRRRRLLPLPLWRPRTDQRLLPSDTDLYVETELTSTRSGRRRADTTWRPYHGIHGSKVTVHTRSSTP